MQWKDGAIKDCLIQPLEFFNDDRGWLCEIFRIDDLPGERRPVMSYLSLTQPGVERGPHEHTDQSDMFVFFDGEFHLYLWDVRNDSSTFGTRFKAVFGRQRPASIIVPPGIVHAYRNCGDAAALSINCPNRLYAGWNKAEAVDEIRHEERSDSPFVLD